MKAAVVFVLLFATVLCRPVSCPLGPLINTFYYNFDIDFIFIFSDTRVRLIEA